MSTDTGVCYFGRGLPKVLCRSAGGVEVGNGVKALEEGGQEGGPVRAHRLDELRVQRIHAPHHVRPHLWAHSRRPQKQGGTKKQDWPLTASSPIHAMSVCTALALEDGFIGCFHDVMFGCRTSSGCRGGGGIAAAQAFVERSGDIEALGQTLLEHVRLFFCQAPQDAQGPPRHVPAPSAIALCTYFSSWSCVLVPSCRRDYDILVKHDSNSLGGTTRCTVALKCDSE